MTDLSLDRAVRLPAGVKYLEPRADAVVDAYPLTAMQQAMLLRSQRDPGAGFYVQQLVCTLREPLDLPEFRSAWQRLVARHPVLRTSFHLDAAPEPLQRVHAEMEAPWREHDWRGLPDQAREDAMQAFLREDRATPFRPDDAPLARFTLFRLGDEVHRLVWTSHHALFDAHARRILLREVFADYQAAVDGREFAAADRRSYGEYVRWLQGAEPPDSRAFWEEELRGFESPNDLVLEAGSGEADGRERHGFDLSAALTAGLRQLAGRGELTLNAVLQGAWALLLSRCTGDGDVVFGATRMCRRGGFAGAGGVVGLLSNTVPLRVRLDARTSVADYLDGVRSRWVRMRPHERVHPARIQAWSEVPSAAPLFQTAIGFQTETAHDALRRLGEAWGGRTFDLLQRVGTPLTVIAHGGPRISLEILYDPARFGGAAIRRMGEHLTHLLRAFVEDPGQPLDRIELLAPAERRHLLEDLNPPAVPLPGSTCVHARFEAWAARAPHAVAVVFQAEALTYGELERRSNRLAHQLARRGVGPDARVGVLLDRGVELVVSLLAVLKAGGCYVPLDPGYPAERLALMLADCDARVLLTRGEHRAAVALDGLAVVCLEEAAEALAGEPVEAPRSGAVAESLAYVVYTSGSTGRPKGVMVAHRHVVQLVCETDYVRIGPGDRVAQASNASFDALAFEAWGALLNGATLVGISRDVLLSPAGFGRVLREERVTTLYQTTALLNQLAREQPGIFAPLREVLFGGQAADADSVRRLLRAGGPRRLLHMYGPTETTAWCSWEQVEAVADDALTVSVGRATRHQRIYLLDTGLRPVPFGAPGEAYVGGAGVVRGYLARPALTAERFLPDPFTAEPGARMYRTGDRLRWTEVRPCEGAEARACDGGEDVGPENASAFARAHARTFALEFVGRVDAQVKIRGFRIEPGEIEAVLSAHAGVREARVVVREDEPGGKRLAAYVVGEADVEAMRAHLRRSLPEYMVPAAFVALERLPLTPNGKLDVKALPAPERGAADRHVAPRTPVEEMLAGIWAEVLCLERVGAEDGFFERGGHSLLAMRVLSRVRELFGVELPVRAIFEGPTVAEVARQVEELRRAELPLPSPLVPVERTAPPPLSFAQERLWLVHQLEGAEALYNIPVARRLAGALDARALERALGEVVRRHEALRTAFREVEGVLEQVIAPFGGFALAREDLSALDAGEREAKVLRRAAADAARPFDLSAGPVFRARLLRLGDEEHVLLLCLHHVAGDGWSLDVLFREMEALYAAYRNGDASPLPELAVQYADFAVWHREHLSGDVLERHLAWWRKQLAGAPELLALPTDRPRPAVPTHRGAHERIDLSAGVLERLRALGRSEGATLYMVLLGAFQLLLSRHGAGDDVVVGSPVAGRPRRELEALIGYFANTLVLRTDLSGDPGFREVLRRVRAATLGAWEHQEVPFDRLVAELRPERSPGHSPLFQVTFTLQDGERPEWSLPGVRASAVETAARVAKFDLLLAMEATPRGLRCGLTYATDLFERETVRGMLGHLERVLEQVAEDAAPRVSELALMGEAERARVVEEGRAGAEFPADRCIQERFEARAAERPEAPALTFAGATLTYGEVNARANRLAHRLRALGVRPETRVGIALERCAELVVAILAVLKAGGGYVPLDPSYPAERIAFVLGDAEVAVLVTASGLLARLPAFAGAALCVDADAEAVAAESAANPRVETAPDALAYVIYTSGSTGRPKGVQVTHANVVRLFDATDAWFGFGASDVWTLFHSCAFDFSVWEIWGALLYGGRLVVVPFLTTRSPEDFHRLLVDQGVTVLSQTPSAFKQLVQADLASGVDPSALRLRHVVFGGEALDPRALRPWMERHGDGRPRLVNLYGITETTVHVTVRAIARADLERAGSPIGTPIPDLSLYLLDGRMEPVPPGVPGEIFVGGAGVARGYLNRPELTAERFVRDPFSAVPDARLYRTGDLARRRADGELEYLGRADQQVKVRGFRIETGEVEAVLAAHPAVAGCAVAAREDGAGERRLVAYVVAVPGAPAPTPAELRAHLAASLPDYMVPAAFAALDALPLTGNGKLDRRALPAPDEARGAAAAERYAAPGTAAERALAEVWREVLGMERVGIDDNYFALGGDSIRSVRLVAAARRRGLSLSIPLVYRHQTVRALAAAADSAGPSPPLPDLPAGPFALLDPAAREGLPDDVEDAYPASQVQLGMLYHTARDPASLAYHEVIAYRVHTRFDAAAMREALRRVAARHPLLRTSFDLAAAPEPIQRVHRRVEIPLEVTDARAPDADDGGAWMEREKACGFDWAAAPLLRFHVQLLADDAFRLILVEHHVVLDGWSVATLVTELLRLFAALRDGVDDGVAPPPATSFRDFVALERREAASAESRAFWRGVTGGAPVAALPPREGGSAPRPDDAPFQLTELPGETAAGLGRVAAAAGVPLKTVLLAAHLRVLAMLGGCDDGVTGYVTNGRPETEDGERVLGVFLNTVPLRVHMAGGTWLELVRRTWAAEQALLPHRRVPLSDIVRDAGGRTPFEVGFNFVHFHVYDALAAAGVRLEGDLYFQKTELPLVTAFSVSHATGSLRLRLEYDPARLGEAQVRAIGGWYARALAALAERPGERWDADPLLDAGEAARLRRLGAGQVVAHEQRPVHRLFEAQAARTPGAVAVACDGATLTYRALDARADRLALRLARLGAGPEARVGVCLERGLELVVALLAVLKAGAAYVPLDPEHPPERLGRVLADSGARLLLTHPALADRAGAWAGAVVALDGKEDADADSAAGAPRTEPDPEGLAYVIYTSGSTGRPKGVAVPHRALANHMQWMGRAFPLAAGDRVLQKTSVGFDASVWEFWAPLLAGATLVMAPPGAHRDPSELLRTVRRERITVLQLVPAVLRALLEHPALPACRTLRTLFCGGEALPADLAARARALTGARVVNLYGPTEACIQSVVHEFAGDPGPTVPIGRPVDNVLAAVLDASGSPVPPGVPGELYLGGVQLARVYLGEPALTAAAFVPDPSGAEPGARLYRTGDRVRWLGGGVLEFLGRADQQVKVRGVRVETGEVEAVLRRHPAVADCVVQARADHRGETRLVAYVVPAPGAAVSAAALRAHLRERFPLPLVPSAFVELGRLPLTPNGKLDRAALPPPEAVRGGGAYLAPRDALELRLARLWEEVLGAGAVGVRDDFFDLGGHSLDALRLLAGVERIAGRRLSMAALVAGPTVERIAAALRGEPALAAAGPLVPLQRGGGARPLFLVHAAGGHVASYVPLARHLGPDQPLFGLQSRGLEGEAPPHARIEAMAADYLAALREVQGEGPYRLGGWSMGGLVAFEMARMLAAAGEEVELLALVDTRPPRGDSPAVAPAAGGRLAGFMLHLGLSPERIATFEEGSAALAPGERLRRAWEAARVADVVPDDLDFPRFERLWSVFRANAAAASAYRPGPCASDLLLVFAEDRPEPAAPEAARWEALTTGTVRVAAVPGDHFTVVREPHVRALAALFADALAHC
jgi:amino acid adenylation domain-containing protein